MSLRSRIVEALKQELVGPAPGLPCIQVNKEEVLGPQDPPRLRYGVGILFPSKAEFQTLETIDAEVGMPGVDDVTDANPDEDKQVLTNTGETDPKSDSRGDSQVENDLKSTGQMSFSQVRWA